MSFDYTNVYKHTLSNGWICNITITKSHSRHDNAETFNLELVVIEPKLGVKVYNRGLAIHYWGYGSCGVVMLERFREWVYGHEKLLEFAPEVWRFLYETLTSFETYTGAGQITFATTDYHLSSGSFNWLINTPPKGSITKLTHQYHNRAHADPDIPKSGTLVKVFWHHKCPESLP